MSEKKLTKTAVKLLHQVIEAIREEPRRLNMHNWITLFNADDPTYQEAVKAKLGVVGVDSTGVVEATVPPCGTQGCIAGWVRILTDPTIRTMQAEARYLRRGLNYSSGGASAFAQTKLKLTTEQAQRLFYFASWGYGGWPAEFESAYRKAKTARGRATATIRRIERFIATNGAE